MDFAGLELPFLSLHCRPRNSAIVWRVMEEVLEVTVCGLLAGVLTLAAAAIVGSGLKFLWNVYGGV